MQNCHTPAGLLLGTLLADYVYFCREGQTRAPMHCFFKRKAILTLFAIGTVMGFSGSSYASSVDNFEEATRILYNSIDWAGEEMPQLDLFQRALIGFCQLKNLNKLSDKEILTLVDFTKSSAKRRLWVIDLKKKKMLFHSLVAHGKNSGGLFADKFSNTPSSLQSSLGFYVTGTTYTGKHGLSLKLHGVERGINDNAEERAIVIHAADYVSDSYIKKEGRLGRSHGCPALPIAHYKEIITHLKDQTCLFIYYPNQEYTANTSFNNLSEAGRYLAVHDVEAIAYGGK